MTGFCVLDSSVGVSYGAGIALRTIGYAPERVSRTALVEVMLPMILYRLRPTRERMMRAAEPLLTEPNEDFARQLGAVYRHVPSRAALERVSERIRAFLQGIDIP